MNNTQNISKIKAKIKVAHYPAIGHPSKDPSGRMTTQNIVLKALRDLGKEDQFKTVYKGIHHVLSTNEYRLLRENNTLFLIKILSQGVGQVQLISADSPKTLLRNILEFLNAVQKAKYTEIHFDTTNQKIINFLEHSGHQVQNTGNNDYVVTL
jgi:DNA-binding MltR family transcriptional regulator